jgi:hypothetical protein
MCVRKCSNMQACFWGFCKVGVVVFASPHLFPASYLCTDQATWAEFWIGFTYRRVCFKGHGVFSASLSENQCIEQWEHIHIYIYILYTCLYTSCMHTCTKPQAGPTLARWPPYNAAGPTLKGCSATPLRHPILFLAYKFLRRHSGSGAAMGANAMISHAVGCRIGLGWVPRPAPMP